MCVTMFLEKREQMLSSFTAEFQQLTLADEKTYLLDNFLHTLSLEMDRDLTWQGIMSHINFSSNINIKNLER